jgi:hypothetical protein
MFVETPVLLPHEQDLFDISELRHARHSGCLITVPGAASAAR